MLCREIIAEGKALVFVYDYTRLTFNVFKKDLINLTEVRGVDHNRIDSRKNPE